MTELIVRNGTLVTPRSTYAADIAVDGGRFVEIAAPGGLQSRAADDEYDAAGQFVLPGVIDGHVHFREPGLEYKEDWTSGSRAAVMGGVTTVLEMPNTLPTTSTAELVAHKRRLAESKAYCDFGLFGLVAQDNLQHLVPMAEAGVVGYKCFLGETTGHIPPPDDGTLLEAMRAVSSTGLRMGFHAENNAIMQHHIRQLKAAGRHDPMAHLDSRPVAAELEAIQRAALFARLSGIPIHIFHLSSRQGLATVDEWRLKGIDVTCETTPHYCFLTSEFMHTLGSLLRMNPPVREPGHADALLRGLVEGRIDAIATDHSPHTLQEKLNDDIWQATSGFAGVETSVRLFLTYAVNVGRMRLQDYARVASEGPARTWGLYPRKGAIEVGSDADLTIVDLERQGVIEAARLHGKNNHTPFEGRRTTGQAVATIVRGHIVMRDGQLVGAARGRMVERQALHTT
ncbi:MAG: allantoinase AllB [Chloroflexi bacterium]|nr:allantoinase AllB [Chloroflexota bacterium]